MDYTKYSQTSPFVKEYAIESDGLPSDFPAADVVNSSDRVVLIDALFRKHYDALSISELIQTTGVDRATIESALDDFQRAGLVTLEDSMFTINNMDDTATDLRHKQLDMM